MATAGFTNYRDCRIRDMGLPIDSRTSAESN